MPATSLLLDKTIRLDAVARAVLQTRDTFLGRTHAVVVYWSIPDLALDRPSTFSWSIGSDRELALRLMNCVNSQAAFGTPTVRHDVNGKSYIDAPALIHGRWMSANLADLGF